MIAFLRCSHSELNIIGLLIMIIKTRSGLGKREIRKTVATSSH
jgi:hypothetical protein